MHPPAASLTCLSSTCAFRFCLAEFNVLLRGFQHTFSDLQLLEFRSFTRSPKSEALEKVAWALGCRSPAEFQQHPHMAALSSVLEVACNDCSEACVSQLTVTTPTWLATWASKWLPSTSDGPPQRITLSVVQAYSSQPPPLRASAVSAAGFCFSFYRLARVGACCLFRAWIMCRLATGNVFLPSFCCRFIILGCQQSPQQPQTKPSTSLGTSSRRNQINNNSLG